MATVHADRIQPQVHPQARPQAQTYAHVRGYPIGRSVLGPLTVLILAGIALDVLLVAVPTLPSQVASSVRHVPGIALAGSSILLLAILVVGGNWEARQLRKAYDEWRRNQRIAKVMPLASALHVSPFALDRVAVDTLHDLTPTDFERAMGALLAMRNFRNVQHTGRAGDECVDLKATMSNGKPVVVQCKRYAPGSNVTSPDVQQFIGMVLVQHRVPLGLYMTTSDYTRDARKLAAEHPEHLQLFDGEDLVRMVRELAVR